MSIFNQSISAARAGQPERGVGTPDLAVFWGCMRHGGLPCAKISDSDTSSHLMGKRIQGHRWRILFLALSSISDYASLPDLTNTRGRLKIQVAYERPSQDLSNQSDAEKEMFDWRSRGAYSIHAVWQKRFSIHSPLSPSRKHPDWEDFALVGP